MPLKINAKPIEPDENTHYLVGPEGLVWVQPAIGDPHIIAARDEAEMRNAALFIGQLLEMGLVPYGLPLNQRVVRAMFGGSAIRDCRWVKHTDAPAPTGEAGDTLPTIAAVIR
jgi:hypothetical protein